MKLEVPLYLQEAKNDCAPTALKMVLEYLDSKKYGKEELFPLVDSDRSGATYTLALAKAAAQLGFKTEFYTTCLGFNPANFNLEFYKTQSDSANETQQKLSRLQQDSTRYGVRMEERHLTLEEILSKLNDDCVAIILLDWDKIKGTTKGYTGHTVPIVGYDADNVYIHNQGQLNPGAFIAVSKQIFEEARKAPGTDEDIVFIYRRSA